MQRRCQGTCINLVTYIDESTITGYMRDKIIDSSYSHHLSEYGALFPNLYQFKGNDAILTAYNSIHLVENKGSGKGNALRSNASCVPLNRVCLHLMTKNLISV